VKRLIECRIKGKVKVAQLFVDDRSYFQAPVILAVFPFLVAGFQREADTYGPSPGCGHHDPWPDMTTYVCCAMIVADGIKKIKPCFKPGVPAMGDLDGFVEDMVGGQYLVPGGFEPSKV